MYDLNKISNNRVTKNIIVNGDESLFNYPPTLYKLILISQKNREFTDSSLSNHQDICLNDNDNYCFKGEYVYACHSLYVDPIIHKCILPSNTESRILVPGINANTNKKGMLTDICYREGSSNGCTGKTPYSSTEFICESGFHKFFDACLTSNSDKKIGYFYYSYFFKLPPIKLSLKNTYKSYYIQFNFLYETNEALRPKENMKGKKLYLFYTDAFRIWHDYSMKYLGIEDNKGNPSKNLIPNFNTENENIFTISVIYNEEKKVYEGKIFLNGAKIYMPTFTGDKLTYILFCHNDTACPVTKEVYWTSGFYNQIRIYEVEKLTSLDLLEIETIPEDEIELFNYYGKQKLS